MQNSCLHESVEAEAEVLQDRQYQFVLSSPGIVVSCECYALISENNYITVDQLSTNVSFMPTTSHNGQILSIR